jgi:hypothetical protein
MKAILALAVVAAALLTGFTIPVAMVAHTSSGGVLVGAHATCKPHGHRRCRSPSPAPATASSSPSPTDTSSPTPAATSSSPSPSPTSTSSSRSPSPGCTTSAAQGECGPYDSYSLITSTTSSTHVGNNVWNPIPGWAQTLNANSPGDWQVTANMPAGNTAVVSYPSIGANYGLITNAPAPLTGFASIISSFTENMNATAGTSAWAAYDIWTNPGGSFNNPGSEVMIQTDFAGNGPCTYQAVAQFGGAAGVPVRTWGLCVLGSELIWKLAPAGAAVGSSATVSESSGSVDILAMLTWLEDHGYMAADSGLGAIGYGWEIASTGGVDEDFTVSSFSLTVSP